jgi:hypothetical protein
MSAPAYATTAQFRDFIKDTSLNDAVPIATILLSASRDVEKICGRAFYQPDTPTVQYFSPARNSPWVLDLDDMDLATTDGLVVAVQWSNGGNYAETWSLGTDYIAEPVNQSVNGIVGWPYTSLRSLAKIWPPRYADFYRDTVKVTATWGWPAVPDPVVQATLMRAFELYKGGEAPFGVAGQGDFGAIRVRDNPMVSSLLQPYKKQTTLLMA